MFDNLEEIKNTVFSLLEQYDMNSVGGRIIGNEHLTIRFSEEDDSEVNYIFTASLKEKDILYEFAVEKVYDVNVSSLECYPKGCYSGKFNTGLTDLENNLSDCINDHDIEDLKEVIEYRDNIYDDLDGWKFNVLTEIL